MPVSAYMKSLLLPRPEELAERSAALASEEKAGRIAEEEDAGPIATWPAWTAEDRWMIADDEAA